MNIKPSIVLAVIIATAAIIKESIDSDSEEK